MVDLANLFRPQPIAALFSADRKVRDSTRQQPYPMPAVLLNAPCGLIDAIEGRLGKVTPLEYKSFLVSILGVFNNLAAVELQAVETRGERLFLTVPNSMLCD